MPDDFLLQIDERRAAYKGALDRGEEPKIEDYLGDTAEPHRSLLFEELLKLDLEIRRQRGQKPIFEDYARSREHVGLAKMVFLEAGCLPLDWTERYRVEQLLGRGGFGTSYLAYDKVLQSRVAIKVPHRELVAACQNADAYLDEARMAFGLRHPNIVRVVNVGSTDHCPCFVVFEFIDGCTLAQKIRDNRPSITQAVEIVATIADALNHAHSRLVHRDVKPGNILLDADGKPYLADFGLALREDNIGFGPRYVGTLAYMSPEQVRGEGNRVDGRSDIFSLGVVFYELLAGRRPFRGQSKSELAQQITTIDPWPLRQINPQIHKELDRICCKALAKRAAERYMTAMDMADDLRHFLIQPTVEEHDQSITVRDRHPEPPVPPASTPDRKCVEIRPKGLRVFDERDADFFPELLPGPRGRDGMPDSILFWKTRIEETDPESTFSVGLIYGPSGCGKTSFVRAGLIPQLSEDVLTVYLQATADNTENRLLKSVRKNCPALPADLSLKESLAVLRRGQSTPRGRKLLIVLDQFEQWLQAKQDDPNAELVQALRQCDGGRVQCIVMVRDDFWMAVIRFMRELEVRLAEGQNSAAVDLFDTDHARKVLAAFGRAFGKLPENPGDTGKEQMEFLTQAISGLAQEGKVICVRLALFAEMMKGRAFTPASLKAVGGTEGVGVTFLEETFSADTAPPDHRYHQKAARAVLKALLPEPGTNIKGHMRSQQELLKESGYANRSKEDYDELIHILDGELHLITPSDPEGVERDEARGSSKESGTPAHERTSDSWPVPRPSSSPPRYYQLTHDYLVPLLREWLTRKQRQTRRGRAELLLAERASDWNARPENRCLPSLSEWGNILRRTERSRWSEAERRMMRRASRVNSLMLARTAVVFVILASAGAAIAAAVYARGLVPNLLVTELDHVPENVKALEHFRWWTDPELRRVLAESRDGSDRKLRASLALLPIDPSQRDYLFNQLLQAGPDQLLILREALQRHAKELTPRLRDLLGSVGEDDPATLPAAAALAAYAPDDACWAESSSKVARALARSDYVSLKGWLDALRPVRGCLKLPLAALFHEDPRSERSARIVDILSDYAADDGALAAALVLDAEPVQFGPLFAIATGNARRLQRAVAVWKLELVPAVERGAPATPEPWQDRRAMRQARAAIALQRCGADAEAVWRNLRLFDRPGVRGFLLELLKPLGIAQVAVAERLQSLPPGKDTAGLQPCDVLFDPVESGRRALVLALGTYEPPADEAGPLKGALINLYIDNPDAGLHAAAEWTLRRWRQGAALAAADAKLSGAAPAARRWYVSSRGLTFSVIEAPGEFIMGARQGEPWRRVHENAHRRILPRRYAIAAKKVSFAQFEAFLKEDNDTERRKRFADRPAPPDPAYPRDNLSWFDAAAYCNWLSRKEGLTPCYLPNKDGYYGPGMSIRKDALDLTGYRLPTEAEWEFAARAGTITSRYYGESERLINRYAWSGSSSGDKLHPSGILLPNDFGLFDVLGNLAEWTQNEALEYPPWEAAPVLDVLDPVTEISSAVPRVLRGGSYIDRDDDVRVIRRDRTAAGDSYPTYGMRPARTIP